MNNSLTTLLSEINKSQCQEDELFSKLVDLDRQSADLDRQRAAIADEVSACKARQADLQDVLIAHARTGEDILILRAKADSVSKTRPTTYQPYRHNVLTAYPTFTPSMINNQGNLIFTGTAKIQ